MAQSGYTPILIYGSGTATNVPLAANLTSTANGAELALNYADGKLYYKSSAGTVTLLADQNAVTVATANGFGGTIAKATATTTPAITIRTSVTGVLVGNGTAVAAAVSGTDFKTINSTSILGSGNISVTSTPGGSTTQVQYNNSGAFGGSANFVFDGTNVAIGTNPPTLYGDTPRLLLYGGASSTSPTIEVSQNGTGVAYHWQMRNGNGIVGWMGSNNTSFVFGTGTSTERVRIASSGGFSVGTTADPGAGAIYATGAITAFYSDRRLKDVKGTITNALDKVSSLSGVYYTNNEVAVAHGYTSAETQVGLLAQDVEVVLPEVVKAAPFDLDEKGNSKSGEHYKTVQYERIIPLLVEAIKELRAEVQALRG